MMVDCLMYNAGLTPERHIKLIDSKKKPISKLPKGFR